MRKIKEMNMVDLPQLGKIFCTNKREALYIFDEIFMNNDYLQNGIKLKPGDTVFDVGANIGLFSLFADRMCSSDITLFAFEPIPYTCSVLRANLEKRLSGKQSINIFNTGLTYESGPRSAVFNYYVRMSGNTTMKSDEKRDEFQAIEINDVINNTKKSSSLLYYLLKVLPFKSSIKGWILDYFLKYEKIECALVPLSEIIKEHQVAGIDLLKIDVEGAELDVLQGIKESHWPIIKQVVLEVHDVKGRLGKIEALLADKGFSVTRKQPQWFEALKLKTWNVFAVR
jgi:FkbM family methyltransferase